MDDLDTVTVTKGELPMDAAVPAAAHNPAVHERFGYLGGSDAAVVLGVSKWKTPYELWCEKRGEAEPDDLSGNERVYFGNILEAIVAAEYSKRTGRKVRRVNRAVFHPKHPWMGGHIDRDVVGEDRILECKTADASRSKDWESGVPDYYLPQVMHYLAVTGRRYCDVAVLIGGNTFRVFEVERDEEFIRDLIACEKAFWDGVTSGNPPDASTSEEASKRFATFRPGTVYADADVLGIVTELRRVKSEIKALEDLEDELETAIKTRMGEDGDELVFGKETLATWKAQTQMRLDTKALEADLPEVVAKYRKPTTFRKFALKG